MKNVVGHRVCWNLLFIDLVCRRFMEELTDQLVDATVKSGGEQQALAVFGRVRENFTDMLEEAELCHVVGLVENGDLHVVE